jgi:GR25 family glycosyltransferase involved in LPS biosynthesis
MHPLNSFFNKIYVISIPRNKTRLDAFLTRTEGIDIEIFNGTDGRTLYPHITYVRDFPPVFFAKYNISYERASKWNKGQLGCALSNFNVQKLIIEKKIDKALILEDDAFLVPERLDYFKNALNELPIDWELFYLGI